MTSYLRPNTITNQKLYEIKQEKMNSLLSNLDSCFNKLRLQNHRQLPRCKFQMAVEDVIVDADIRNSTSLWRVQIKTYFDSKQLEDAVYVNFKDNILYM